LANSDDLTLLNNFCDLSIALLACASTFSSEEVRLQLKRGLSQSDKDGFQPVSL
jgi:hypothetical protein